MAAVNLIWRPTVVTIATVELDASISEKHTIKVDSTDSPVEQGTDISDHLRRKPIELTIEGMVTNFPLAGAPSQTIVVSNEDAEPASDYQFISTSAYTQGRAEQSYAILDRLAGSSTLFQVVTSLRTYDSMALVSLEVPRNAQIGEALRFTAQFKEIQVVSNANVSVAIAQPSAVPNNNVGKTPAGEDNSVANALGNAFVNGVKSVYLAITG